MLTQQEQNQYEMLRQTLGRMEIVLGQIDDAIVWVNAQGHIQWCNLNFDLLIQRNHIETLGASLIHLLPLYIKEVAIDDQNHPLNKMLVNHHEHFGVYQFYCQNQKFDIELSAKYFELNGTESFGLVIIRDISERLCSEKFLADKTLALEKQNNELEKFAYIVSHDLKAPLRAIDNLSSWIEEDLAEVITEDVQKNMTLLRQRVARMDNMIKAILNYARVGRIDTEVSGVDVNELLSEIINGLLIPSGFVIEIENDLPFFNTCRTPLSQVFANLISNAIKYHHCAEQGRIKISVTEPNDNYYLFSVADNGPGIEEEYHEKIFNIFQTINARDQIDSTGVGLSIVKKIINDFGGEIFIDSSLGQGCTFSFSIPKNYSH